MGSNHRHSGSEPDALPAELYPYNLVDAAGFEPATDRLKADYSDLTELRVLKGPVNHDNVYIIIKPWFGILI